MVMAMEMVMAMVLWWTHTFALLAMEMVIVMDCSDPLQNLREKKIAV